MRTMVIVISLVVGMTAYAAFAPDQAAPPTVVGERGIYECPNHAEIQATWPAQCPTCQTVLERASSLNAVAANTVLAAASDGNMGTGQSTQYGTSSGSYPPYYPYGTQGYPPYTPSQQYGTQGSYPPNYPYGSQGYPPYPPSGQYGQQYPPYGQTEPNNPYAGILEELNRLFSRRNQQLQ